MKNSKNIKEVFEILIHKDALNKAHFDGKSLALFESKIPNNKTQLHTVYIESIREVYAAIKLDIDRLDFLHPNGLIKNCKEEKEDDKKHHAHKRCDYLVFCKVAEKDYILLIEMKSEEAKEIPEKIKSTKAITAYIIELIKQFYNIELGHSKQINILFDKKTTKDILTIDMEDVKYKHKGFSSQEGRVHIHPFLK